MHLLYDMWCTLFRFFIEGDYLLYWVASLYGSEKPPAYLHGCMAYPQPDQRDCTSYSRIPYMYSHIVLLFIPHNQIQALPKSFISTFTLSDQSDVFLMLGSPTQKRWCWKLNKSIIQDPVVNHTIQADQDQYILMIWKTLTKWPYGKHINAASRTLIKIR